MKKTMVLEITYKAEYGDAVLEHILESIGIVKVKVLKGEKRWEKLK